MPSKPPKFRDKTEKYSIREEVLVLVENIKNAPDKWKVDPYTYCTFYSRMEPFLLIKWTANSFYQHLQALFGGYVNRKHLGTIEILHPKNNIRLNPRETNLLKEVFENLYDQYIRKEDSLIKIPFQDLKVENLSKQGDNKNG